MLVIYILLTRSVCEMKRFFSLVFTVGIFFEEEEEEMSEFADGKKQATSADDYRVIIRYKIGKNKNTIILSAFNDVFSRSRSSTNFFFLPACLQELMSWHLKNYERTVCRLQS